MMKGLDLKRRVSTTQIKYYVLIGLIIILTIGMGIGYSYIQKDLKIQGNLEVSKFNGKKVNILGTIQIAYMDNEASEFVSSPLGIVFEEESSDINGKGLYIRAGTENDEYPIYYYRGAVTNNNVLFAGYCWKILRTDEKGNVKLVYSGVVSSTGMCDKTGRAAAIGTSLYNTNYKEEKYIGYMYTTNITDDTNSTIKEKVDTWYKNNMLTYESYLEDTIFCNDRLVYSKEGTTTIYDSYRRVVLSHKPSLTCNQDEDKFTVSNSTGNGKLTYPVGLMTIDEVDLAGRSVDYFLYTGTESDFWTMSPGRYASGKLTSSTVGSMIAYVYQAGNSYYIGLESVYSYSDLPSYLTAYDSVRPVIALKKDILISDGDGSIEHPYVIR